MALAFSVIFLALHLPFLAVRPGDIDGANFALGVRDFDVVNHRPHPPGYPVYIALGKISDAAMSGLHVTKRHEARALAVWSALAGALSLLPLFVFFTALEFDRRRAVAAAALTMTSPLFWFSSVRALSDVPGLTAALVPQALLVAAFRQGERARLDSSGGTARFPFNTLIVCGALMAGFVMGLRSQTVWLTLPLLVVVLAFRIPRSGMRAAIYAAAAFGAGVLIWAVPALIESGGSFAYLGAVEKQGLEDLASGDLLVTNPTPARLMAGLVHTFAFPWADRYLAITMLALGAVGAGVMALRSTSALVLLLVAAAPYGLFHLLFQESISTRYGLPIIPAVAYFAVRGLDTMAPRLMLPGALMLSLASVGIAMPAVQAYGHTGSPADQVVAEIEKRLMLTPSERPVLASHHAIGRALRAAELPMRAFSSRPRHEWLELVKYWRGGGQAPVWFLAEPRRTDLALIDPASRRLIGSYEWTLSRRLLVSGVRPEAIDWHEIRSPGWFVEEGWALTPEVQGVSTADGRGPAVEPIVAYLRRRPEAATLMIGGRNLGLRGDREARVEVTLDGRPFDSWIAPPEDRPFLTVQTIPAGMLTGRDPYATLKIRARAADGSARPVSVAIEQFDVQSVNAPLMAFDAGWYQTEYDPVVGRTWRWMGSSATVRMRHGGRDRTLRARAEVPLQYLHDPPTIVVRAGEQILAQITPTSAALTFEARLPARALDESAGVLTFETNSTYVPAAVSRSCNCDQRSLGLRLYDLQVR